MATQKRAEALTIDSLFAQVETGADKSVNRAKTGKTKAERLLEIAMSSGVVTPEELEGFENAVKARSESLKVAQNFADLDMGKKVILSDLKNSKALTSAKKRVKSLTEKDKLFTEAIETEYGSFSYHPEFHLKPKVYKACKAEGCPTFTITRAMGKLIAFKVDSKLNITDKSVVVGEESDITGTRKPQF